MHDTEAKASAISTVTTTPSPTLSSIYAIHLECQINMTPLDIGEHPLIGWKGDKLPYPPSTAKWARANRDLRVIGCHPFAPHKALLGFGMMILLFLFKIVG